jgi:hypothetical protein
VTAPGLRPVSDLHVAATIIRQVAPTLDPALHAALEAEARRLEETVRRVRVMSRIHEGTQR